MTVKPLRKLFGPCCIFMTYILFTYAYGAYTFILIRYRPSNLSREIDLFIFTVLLSLAIWSHLAAMLRDPGYISPLPNTSMAKQAQTERTTTRKTGTLTASSKNIARCFPASPLNKLEDGVRSSQEKSETKTAPQQGAVSFESSARWCRICRWEKPYNVHHCSSCERCVLRMDHHCPWIHNCIGVKNRKMFLLFLLYVCSVSWFGLFKTCAHIFPCWLASTLPRSLSDSQQPYAADRPFVQNFAFYNRTERHPSQQLILPLSIISKPSNHPRTPQSPTAETTAKCFFLRLYKVAAVFFSLPSLVLPYTEHTTNDNAQRLITHMLTHFCTQCFSRLQANDFCHWSSRLHSALLMVFLFESVTVGLLSFILLYDQLIAVGYDITAIERKQQQRYKPWNLRRGLQTYCLPSQCWTWLLPV